MVESDLAMMSAILEEVTYDSDPATLASLQQLLAGESSNAKMLLP